jgi:hypothetical protein
VCKARASIVGMIGILAIALLLAPGQAPAGASASAPSKYRPNQVGLTHQERQAPRSNPNATEFSSSKRKPSTHQSYD